MPDLDESELREIRPVLAASAPRHDRAALEAVERALRLAGNRAITRAQPLERAHRDVRRRCIHAPRGDSACVAAGRCARRLAA